jgi:hypothetical protein
MAAASAAVGGVGIAVAVAEYHPPWPSTWFITGIVLCGLGCAFAVWALVLSLAHKVAGDRWCPDPRAHVPEAELLPRFPFGLVPDGLVRRRFAEEVTEAAANRKEQRELARSLLPGLREMNGDLRQAAAGVEKAQNDGTYAGVRHEFDVGQRWEANRERLAGLVEAGNLYYSLRDAFAHIARIHRIVSESPTEPEPGLKPDQSHDLAGALAAIRNAETGVSEILPS